MDNMFMLLSSSGYGYSSSDTVGAVIVGLLTMILSVTPALIAIIICAVSGLICLAIYLAWAIAEYKILKKAEYDKPWFSFIPFLQIYPLIVLPYKAEFDLGIFKLPRKTAALIVVLTPIAIWVLSMVFMVVMFIPFIGTILWSLFCMLMSVVGIALKVFNWRTYYDFYGMYMEENNRLIFSILGIFIPIIPLIFLFIFIGKEPAYKWTAQE